MAIKEPHPVYKLTGCLYYLSPGSDEMTESMCKFGCSRSTLTVIVKICQPYVMTRSMQLLPQLGTLIDIGLQ